MTQLRVGAGVTASLLALAVAACGDAEGPGAVGTGHADAFCAEVLPKVEAFMADAGRRAVVPDDDRYGGTAVVGATVDPPGGMNPAVTSNYQGVQYQDFVLFTTLVRYDEDLQAQPYLAESWEFNADSSMLTFRLRDDVYWHDGELVDAGDVAFTFRLVSDPETGFANPAYWDNYDKSEEGVEVLDDVTVRFHMRPHQDPLDPWRATAVMPEHLLGDVAPGEVGNHPFGTVCPVGNGPFRFVEHRPGDRWVFEANPAFPEELGGRPYLDRLIHRVIPQQSTLLTELLTGGIHVYAGTQPSQVDRIRQSRDAYLLDFVHREYAFVAWNARRPILSDARVRTAITLATDREEIVQTVLRGFGAVAHTTVHMRHWAFDPSVFTPLDYDPARARALLDEAGWVDSDGDGVRDKDGIPLSITLKYNQGNQTRQAIGELMRARLAEVGVDLRLVVLEAQLLTQQIILNPERDFDGFLISWIADFKLDDRDLFHSERIDAPIAMSGTNNPGLDELLDTLQLIPDRAQAKEVWAEYQRRLIAEQPYTFLYFTRRLAGVHRTLNGVQMDARGEWVGVHDWWLDPSER